MSSEIDKENKKEKNDWDDEDDSWDDWGEAEDKVHEILDEKHKTNTTVESQSRPIPLTTDINSYSQAFNSNNKEVREVENDKREEAGESRSSWGLWGSKFTSVLSTATEGLGNITTSVSQTLDQVIGVPDPEKLARQNAELEAKSQTRNPSEKSAKDDINCQESKNETAGNYQVPGFGLNLVSGVTNIGSKVLTTGLDTLEGIGKKTMDLLQENDPLLKNKRKFLGLDPDKPNLSAVLKEAKRDAETLETILKDLKLEKTKASLRFEILFENYCGLVHYEALEILSKESKIKIEALLDAVSGKALDDLKETLEEVKELTELEDTDGESEGEYEPKELNDRLDTAIADLELPIKFNDIVKLWLDSLEWLSNESSAAATQDAFSKGVTSLAELCSLEMNKLHKIAELLLIKEHHSTANEVDALIQLCKQFNSHLSGHTTRFASILSNRSEDDDAKNLVTTLFSELLVAMDHINKAFKLFLPILQLGAI